jgi:hypothetical protein
MDVMLMVEPTSFYVIINEKYGCDAYAERHAE